MNTTNYTIELLITGVCSAIWIAFIFATVLGDKIPPELIELGKTNKIILALFLVPIIYVVGVILDRIVDDLSNMVMKEKKKQGYRYKRSIIYMKYDQLIDIYEYGRMRLRICRNWIFNGTLILFTGIMYLWNGSTLITDYSTKLSVSIVFGMLISFSIILAFYGYNNLRHSELNFLDIQHNIIRGEQN